MNRYGMLSKGRKIMKSLKKYVLLLLLCSIRTLLAVDLPVLITPQDVYPLNNLTEHVGKLYIARNLNAVMKLTPVEKWQNVNEVRLDIFLPDGLNCDIIAFPGHSSNTVVLQPQFKDVPGGRICSQILNKRTWSRRASHTLYFSGSCENGKKVSLQFYADGKKANYREFAVEMIDVPPVPLPENYPLFGYYVRGVEVPDTELASRNADLSEFVNLKGIVSPRNLSQPAVMPSYRMLEKRNWIFGYQIGHEDMDKMGMPYSGAVACRDEDGDAVEPDFPDFWVRYCPEYLKTEFAKRAASRHIRTDRIKCDMLYLDLEIYSDTRMLGICKCPRCLEAFSRHSGIAKNQFTAKNVEKKFPAQWLAFREKQQAEMVGAYADMFRFKGKPVGLAWNSIYESIGDNSFGIVKNAHYEAFSSYIMPMVYLRGTRIFDVVDYNVKSTRAPFVPMTYSNAGHYPADWNTPEEIALNLVMAAACGAKGQAFYCDLDIDGRYVLLMRKALGVVAASEKFNNSAARCDREVKVVSNAPRRMLEVDGKAIPTSAETLDYFRYTARKMDGKYLISLFNYNPAASCRVKVALPEIPAGRYSVTDLASGNRCFLDGEARISAGQLKDGLPMVIAPRGYNVFVIEADQNGDIPAAAAGKTWDLRSATENTSGEVVEKRLSGNGLSISRTDRMKNGKYAVKLESPALTAWINLDDNGKIEQLLDKKTGKMLLREPGLGLFREFFDEPFCEKIEVPYQVVNRRIFADRAEVELLVQIRHGRLKDFEIVKKYTIYRDRPELKAAYKITVRRDVKSQADFRMRIQNRIDFGNKAADLCDFTSIAAVCGGKELKFSGRQHIAFGTADGTFKGYLAKTLKGKFDAPEFTISSPDGALKFRCSKSSDARQFFSWRAGVPTAEIFFAKTDFPSDPHQSRVWQGEVSVTLSSK